MHYDPGNNRVSINAEYSTKDNLNLGWVDDQRDATDLVSIRNHYAIIELDDAHKLSGSEGVLAL